MVLGELIPRLVRCAAFGVLLLLVVAACSGSPGVVPGPVGTGSAVAGAPGLGREKAPCEVAAELRGRVPRLMGEGKLHRTGRVIEKANRLCPGTARETWGAEVEVLAALGRYGEAKELIRR